ncbi:F-box domain-containing protein [Tribonema minus]|uniref:F-box domain-containing protein n=1 Tax=Tribonema minus TaxID=303371 RepID=A0A835Z3T4_9STRA|nr:F-box domain-containing protein [Tribonema minus]
MAFDGEFLITGGADRTVKVHRNTISPGPGPQRLGECLHTWKGHTERVIGVVRPEGTRQVVSAAPDAKLIFWDLDTGEKIRELELPAPILCLGAAEGYLAVGMMNGNVSVFTDKTGEEVLTWQAYQRAAVRSIYFPSQTRIMTGGGNGVVRFWDLKEGGTPDGGFYTIEGRGIAHEYKGHNAPVVALQGDEVKIVSAASDGVVRVFDMKMGEELFRIEGHSDDIRSLQFDRRFLITDGTMNTIVVHDFASEEGSDEFEIEGFELEDE